MLKKLRGVVESPNQTSEERKAKPRGPYEIKMTKAWAMPGWLLIFDHEHTYLIPEDEFVSIVIEAGRRFKTMAPIAPYEWHGFGLVLKTNKQIYMWIVKQLREIQRKYEYEVLKK